MTDRRYPPLASSPAGIKQIVVLAIFYPLAFIAVILRLSSRALKRKTLAFNDYAVMVALFFTTGQITINTLAVVWAGAGHHITDVDLRYRARIFVVFSAGQSVWAAANTAVKFSILHLYMTIFPSARLHRICYCIMALAMGYWISVFLETFLLCKPVKFNWDKTIAGTCDPNSLLAYVFAASINLVIDVFIVILPMPLLWRLQLSLPKKIGTTSMFSLGGIICIISLLRVIYIAKMDINDFTYAAADLAVWSFLEPSLGIINASLPVLKPVGLRIFNSSAVEWAKSSFRATRSAGPSSNGQKGGGIWTGSRSKKSHADSFRRLGDSTDRMYPLDTINLVGTEDRRESGVSCIGYPREAVLHSKHQSGSGDDLE